MLNLFILVKFILKITKDGLNYPSFAHFNQCDKTCPTTHLLVYPLSRWFWEYWGNSQGFRLTCATVNPFSLTLYKIIDHIENPAGKYNFIGKKPSIIHYLVGRIELHYPTTHCTKFNLGHTPYIYEFCYYSSFSFFFDNSIQFSLILHTLTHYCLVFSLLLLINFWPFYNQLKGLCFINLGI